MKYIIKSEVLSWNNWNYFHYKLTGNIATCLRDCAVLAWEISCEVVSWCMLTWCQSQFEALQWALSLRRSRRMCCARRMDNLGVPNEAYCGVHVESLLCILRRRVYSSWQDYRNFCSVQCNNKVLLLLELLIEISDGLSEAMERRRV